MMGMGAFYHDGHSYCIWFGGTAKRLLGSGEGPVKWERSRLLGLLPV